METAWAFVGRYSYGIDLESKAIITWNEGSKLVIGSFCSFARGVTIFLGGNHHTDWVTTYPFGNIFQEVFGGEQHAPLTNGDVVIGNDVWVGTNACIMSGVTIGDGAVIAANAHVVRNVDPYEIVGGNPARHIRYRFDQETIDYLLELKWWNWPESKIKENIEFLCSPPLRGGKTLIAGALSAGSPSNLEIAHEHA
jgi:acetyltransferase-like isoleucine patch superfamily enzyme